MPGGIILLDSLMIRIILMIFLGLRLLNNKLVLFNNKFYYVVGCAG